MLHRACKASLILLGIRNWDALCFPFYCYKNLVVKYDGNAIFVPIWFWGAVSAGVYCKACYFGHV